jgi:hypothetical protein
MLPSSYLLIAQSGRALAASATRGNCPIHVMDCFADIDTCAEALSVVQVPFTDHSFDKDFLINAVKKRCLEQPGMQLVPGSGFERKPALLRTLSDIAPCIGNPAEVVEKIKDPVCFFDVLDELGIPHPPTTTLHQDSGNNWLFAWTRIRRFLAVEFISSSASKASPIRYYSWPMANGHRYWVLVNSGMQMIL